MGTITDQHGRVIAEFADTLEDWRQAATVEARVRREFQVKFAAAQAIICDLLESYLIIFDGNKDELALRAERILQDASEPANIRQVVS